MLLLSSTLFVSGVAGGTGVVVVEYAIFTAIAVIVPIVARIVYPTFHTPLPLSSVDTNVVTALVDKEKESSVQVSSLFTVFVAISVWLLCRVFCASSCSISQSIVVFCIVTS